MEPLEIDILYDNPRILDRILEEYPNYYVKKRRRVDDDSVIATLKYRMPENFKTLTHLSKHFLKTVHAIKTYLKERDYMSEDNVPTPKAYDEEIVKAMKVDGKGTRHVGHEVIFFWDCEKLERFIKLPTLFDEVTNFTDFGVFGNNVLRLLYKCAEKIGLRKIERLYGKGEVPYSIYELMYVPSGNVLDEGIDVTELERIKRGKVDPKRKYYKEVIRPQLQEMRKLLVRFAPEDLEVYDEIYEYLDHYGTKLKKPQ